MNIDIFAWDVEFSPPTVPQRVFIIDSHIAISLLRLPFRGPQSF